MRYFLLLNLFFCTLSHAAEDVIDVMSFNIRYINPGDGDNQWKYRKEVVLKQVRDIGPDLIGFQEMLVTQRDYLKTGLVDYDVVGVGRDDGKIKGEMAAVFFRTDRFLLVDAGHFWLSESPEVVGSRGWDARIPRIATWVKLQDRKKPEAQPIFFLNVHFDHRGREARNESASLIVRRLHALGDGCRRVVTGDFNAPEGSKPYRTLFDPGTSGLIDTYRRVVPAMTPNEGTFNGFRGKSDGGRIDWIACSEEFGVADARILNKMIDGRWPSDHFAISARLVGL